MVVVVVTGVAAGDAADYGTNVNFTPPIVGTGSIELVNPNWKGCIDRNA